MKALVIAIAAFTLPVYAQQAVLLVRHAELQGGAMAEPKHLPLSEAGAARAERPAATRKDVSIGAICVTDFVRPRQTAEPQARAIGEEPTVLPKGVPQA